MSILFEKREGETPLQTLERMRAERGISMDTPLTYAGRLDPMASGVLLVLVGDECKNRSAYDGLDKEYEFGVLLGVSSDTGDILGLVRHFPIPAIPSDAGARSVGKRIEGPWTMPYPLLSSKPVRGRPLLEHALKGAVVQEEAPTKDVRIYSCELIGSTRVSLSACAREAEERIRAFHPPKSEIPGSDFRKREVCESWRRIPDGDSVILSFKARVSSGTYIRALAPRIAREFGTSGIAWSIRRVMIGDRSD